MQDSPGWPESGRSRLGPRDIGLTHRYRQSQLRFEVDGANAAGDFLRSCGIPESPVESVRDAIASHTTPGIPESKKAEAALAASGVELDLLRIAYGQFTQAQRSNCCGPPTRAEPMRILAGGAGKDFAEAIRRETPVRVSIIKENNIEPGNQPGRPQKLPGDSSQGRSCLPNRAAGPAFGCNI